MRLNVLDLFTTPLRLCQPQLSLFRRSRTAALGGGGGGFLKQSTSFTLETSFPVHSIGGTRCLNSPFLQRDAGMIISTQYQSKKVPQPRHGAILLVIEPKLCKIGGCGCSNQKKQGRR